ncbi:MAG: CCA tRNA nucleotidyltransferase [Lachnospiraceae bacterium]|nr:CCA tRNA nucleotidyltransferase [Lachnospiraceae bacterium]
MRYVRTEKLHIDVPAPVAFLLSRLNAAGYEAFAVGGCVRDAMMGREPNDWDITTSALPAQIKKCFRRTIDTGIKHGTVTVVLREGSFEVTTYRIDGVYEDGRHPKEVSFTDDLTEDLRRRDFTVNAMAYHPDLGLADVFGGREDLQAKIIRAVGVPAERFEEDALRIMRAVRFAAQLDFSIEPATLAEVANFAPRLEMISRERIQTELVKLLVSGRPDRFSLLMDTGIADVIMPGLKPRISTRLIGALERVPAHPHLRLAVLFADCPPEEAEAWLRENKFDNDTVFTVAHLIRYSFFPFEHDAPGVRRAVCAVRPEYFPSLLKVMRALDRIPDLDGIEAVYDAVTAAGDCVTLKQLAVTGGDLIKAGIRPGPGMGQILQQLLDRVLEDPSLNTKEQLLPAAVLLSKN